MAGTRVRDVVRDIVAEAAPEELPLVAGLSQFDDDTAVRKLSRRRRPREPLGFGLDEIAVLATPAVWLAVDEAAKRVGSKAVDGTAKGAKALLRKVFRKNKAPATIPALTHDQVTVVRQRVIELAKKSGMDTEAADTLGDRVAARLLLDADD